TVFQMHRDDLYRVWDKYEMLRNFAMAILGAIVFIRKFPELDTLDKDILASAKKRGADFKVLDTSAIIDGRVVDICETRFLSGQVLVPRFILGELQHLADSPDGMRRARGRRGLDMLARLQEGETVPVKILDRDIPEIEGVDAKVVRLARELGAKVVTTDFNLNKVAALEGVVCLNVNDLTTALKPVVLPGETMTIFVMKEGKEREQGVGYLDDGTMVVVEDGKRHIGKRVDCQVASILQTSAGRMIFTKFKAER
ncbi:MAG TPA: TRAM domain-containing protein, partial [Elusimicrobiota bacterium]|nr:TRAM domain-containing protein [Elusimicrobiota bacterium]